MSDWRKRAKFSNDPTYKLRFIDAKVAAEYRDPVFDGKKSNGDGSVSDVGGDAPLKYLITTPNMSFVPRPFWGKLHVSVKADGRFGKEDPILWPQEFNPDTSYRYLSCIPRLSHPRRHAEVWKTLHQSDMRQSSKALRALFVVNEETLAHVRQCLDELDESIVEYSKDHRNSHRARQIQLAAENAYDRLSVPATVRDLRQQFLSVERFYLMTLAWLIWEERIVRSAHEPQEVDEMLMGTFTGSPEVAQKYFQAGIPVWLLRPASNIDHSFTIVNVVKFTEPSLLETESGEYSSTPVYVGPPGPGQLNAICYRSSLYLDFEPTPFPSDYGLDEAEAGNSAASASRTANSSNRDNVSAPSTASQPSIPKKKGKGAKPAHRQPQQIDRSKFDDLPNPRVPPLVPAWKEALIQGAAFQYAPDGEEIWGYWTPEPALVVGSESEKRRERYVLNWLKIRGAWYYVTRDVRYRTPLFARQWRLFLDDGLEPTAHVHQSKVEQRRMLIQTLTDVFGQNGIDVNNLEPTWFGRTITLVDDHLAREVAWELSEVGFMTELLMLDAKLHELDPSDLQDISRRTQYIAQAFPSMKGFQVSQIPTRRVGLSATNPAERGRALEGLRRLMLHWPGVPQVLKAAKPLDVDQSRLTRMEAEISRFYVEAFVKAAGRPPVLPRPPPHTPVD